VDRISFAVRRAEIFGLLGPNGAGKSTTFKMLCGLLPITSGTARLTGLSLAEAPALARARLGYMSQKFSLYPDLSVQQNLEFFAGAYGLGGRKRREAVGRMKASGWSLSPRPMPASCRWVSSNGWRWPARSCTARRSSSWTSRHPASIR
jgi:ABC-2 type transport system ATP-binding protein